MSEVALMELDVLPRGTLTALENAIRWMGHAATDEEIRKARQALRDLKRQQKALRFLLRHVSDVRAATAAIH